MNENETGYQFHRRKILYARELRSHMTPEESIAWKALRNRRLAGYKFRRQAPVGKYIVDFLCAEKRFVIEIDGDVHRTQQEYDIRRDEDLRQAGYIVMRCSNEDIRHALPTLLAHIQSLMSFPSPTSNSELERGQG